MKNISWCHLKIGKEGTIDYIENDRSLDLFHSKDTGILHVKMTEKIREGIDNDVSFIKAVDIPLPLEAAIDLRNTLDKYINGTLTEEDIAELQPE